MAKDASFDIVSEVDLQIIDDVINVAMKEINNRFDLKGTNSEIKLKRNEKQAIFSAPSEFQINQLKDILRQKMAKREISSKCLIPQKQEKISGDSVREINNIVCGITSEIAKKIVKDIKSTKIKVQASIQEEKIRVSGKNRDDLQSVIAMVKDKEYSIPLQFTNYR